jgi:hypothetical protein
MVICPDESMLVRVFLFDRLKEKPMTKNDLVSIITTTIGFSKKESQNITIYVIGEIR